MFSFDPFAGLLAVAALWIAYLAYRSSCKIWVKILEVSGGLTCSIYEPGHHHFDVVVQNLGLSLHRVRVCLFFRDRDGANYTLELRRVEYRDRHKVVDQHGEFAQGMIGAFRLRSTDLEKHEGRGIDMLRKLEDVRQCDAKIHVYSQDYLVAEFQLWYRTYWLKSQWNRVAHKVNWRFNANVDTSEGETLLKLGSVLPTFNIDRQWRLECFVRSVIKETST